MPTYTINKIQNGIELYFQTKPDKTTLDLLKRNNWRWNSNKKCWYAKKTTTNEKFAKSICSQEQKMEIKQPKVATRARNSVSFTQRHVYNDIKITIKKEQNNKFSVYSSDNLIQCIDCKRTVSIHSTNCIFCGCPLNHTFNKTYDAKSIEIDLEIQKQNQERENKYRNDCITFLIQKGVFYSQKYKNLLLDMSIEEFNSTITRLNILVEEKNQLPILTESEKMECISFEEYEFSLWLNNLKLLKLKEYQQKLEKERQEREKEKKRIEEFNQKAKEIDDLCSAFNFSKSTMTDIYMNMSIEEVRERVDLISYYNTRHNINLSGRHFLMTRDELNKYLWSLKDKGQL